MASARVVGVVGPHRAGRSLVINSLIKRDVLPINGNCAATTIVIINAPPPIPTTPPDWIEVTDSLVSRMYHGDREARTAIGASLVACAGERITVRLAFHDTLGVGRFVKYPCFGADRAAANNFCYQNAREIAEECTEILVVAQSTELLGSRASQAALCSLVLRAPLIYPHLCTVTTYSGAVVDLGSSIEARLNTAWPTGADGDVTVFRTYHAPTRSSGRHHFVVSVAPDGAALSSSPLTTAGESEHAVSPAVWRSVTTSHPTMQDRPLRESPHLLDIASLILARWNAGGPSLLRVPAGARQTSAVVSSDTERLALHHDALDAFLVLYRGFFVEIWERQDLELLRPSFVSACADDPLREALGHKVILPVSSGTVELDPLSAPRPLLDSLLHSVVSTALDRFVQRRLASRR